MDEDVSVLQMISRLLPHCHEVWRPELLIPLVLLLLSALSELRLLFLLWLLLRLLRRRE